MADEQEKTYTEEEVTRLVQAGALANSVMEEEVELVELTPDIPNGNFVFRFTNGVTLTVPAAGIEQGEAAQ
jgi:hypothetical protein